MWPETLLHRSPHMSMDFYNSIGGTLPSNTELNPLGARNLGNTEQFSIA